MPTFVLNDETKVNSYGFRILNKGINLDRFKANPVMLDQHWNSTGSVLGKWDNIRIEGSQLLADSAFDTEDEQAKKIAGKVDRGFIKGASMGVTFNRDYMERMPDESYVLKQCELFEASIVAVPSNANAITLFAENGALLSADEIQLSISTITTKFKNDDNTNSPKMEKIILSAAALVALGLTLAPEDSASLNAAIEDLSKKYAAEKTAREALQIKVDAQSKSQASALVEQAVLAGKITADVKEKFVEMATGNYDLAAQIIGAMPGKANLSGQLDNKSGAAGEGPKTIDEFEKLPVAKQLAFKNENPEAYAALFA